MYSPSTYERFIWGGVPLGRSIISTFHGSPEVCDEGSEYPKPVCTLFGECFVSMFLSEGPHGMISACLDFTHPYEQTLLRGEYLYSGIPMPGVP